MRVFNKLPIWQSVWQGIRFKDLPPSRSTSEFYKNFYNRFFEIYDSFEEIDIHWRKEKNMIAEELSSIIEKNANCLSIGSGIGFIEKKLASERRDLTIYLSDEDAEFSKWVSVENVKLITEEKKITIQKIYMVQILYLLSDVEIKNLIASLKREYPRFDEIIFVDRFLDNQSVNSSILLWEFIRHIFFESIKKILGERVIFWGVIRSLSFFRTMIERNKKCDLTELYLVGDEYLIRYKVRY